jgi:trans-aconitate 2-methyltransferase
MTWDPDRYEQFSDHRLRPGLDLIARIPPIEPVQIVDLGCGTGTLTAVLAARFPSSSVLGLDSSPEMLARAESFPDVEWQLADISDWRPDTPVGVVFSNATLHWLDDHPRLFERLAAAVEQDGVLAVQMPDNWREPTHTIPARILDEGDFGSAGDVLVRDRVAEPGQYRAWIGDRFDLDVWTTTYSHMLTGTDPVLDWVRGSVLAPVLELLDDHKRERFLSACAAGYRETYPTQPDGMTMLPFRRLFIVGRRR